MLCSFLAGLERADGGSCGEPGPQDVGDEPGHLFEYGGYQDQQHLASLGPTSQVVQDLNTYVFVAQGGGQQGQQRAGGAAGWSGTDGGPEGGEHGEDMGQQQQQQHEREEEEDPLFVGYAASAGRPLVVTNGDPRQVIQRPNTVDPWKGVVGAGPSWLSQRHPKYWGWRFSRAAEPQARSSAAAVPSGGEARYQLRLLQCSDSAVSELCNKSACITLELRARRA